MLRIKVTFATSDSNTTSVKVKRCRRWLRYTNTRRHSNTTNVKVKRNIKNLESIRDQNSNTTNVKVKLAYLSAS